MEDQQDANSRAKSVFWNDQQLLFNFAQKDERTSFQNTPCASEIGV